METVSSTVDDAKRIVLEGDMTIYHAADVKACLLAAVRTTRMLEVDLSHVGEIDTTGVQLLVLAKRETERLGHELRIVAHSPGVRAVFDFYNMDAWFGDPIVIPAQ